MPDRRWATRLRQGVARALLLAALALVLGLGCALPFDAVAQSETPTPTTDAPQQIPDPTQVTAPDATPAPSPVADQSGLGDVQLGVGQAAKLDGGALQVTLLRVEEDSRCPSNVMCIWAGRAVVVVDVSVGGVARGEQKLVLFPTRRVPVPSPDLDAIVDRYVLSLVDVQPYPLAGGNQPLSQKTATIRVTVSP